MLLQIVQIISLFHDTPDALLWPAVITAFVFGTAIGSFLNVIIYRLPRNQSIVFPGSRCGSCGAPVRPYDNIPIISYLVLGGRCRNCRASFSARYPAVEALTGLIFALVAWRVVQYFSYAQTYQAAIGSGKSVSFLAFVLTLAFDSAFVAALIALIFIDAEHMILPNAITYPGFAVALLARLLVPNLDGIGLFINPVSAGIPTALLSLVGALAGAVVGGGSLWLVGWLWERLRGVEAMGLGDVKMMFMVGAYLGWPRTILTIFLAVLTGSLVGIGLMLRRGERDMQMLLPFGIFLGLGAIISLLIGDAVVAWYASQF